MRCGRGETAQHREARRQPAAAANGTLPAPPAELRPDLDEMSEPQVADALARAQRAGTMLAASEVLVRTSPLNRPGRYIDAHFKARPNDHPWVSGDGVDAVPHPGHVLYAL